MKYDYLTVSTRKSNDKRVAKQRDPATQVRGEQCPYAKLTDNLVRRIRKMYVPKHKGATYIQRTLAKEGVHIKRPTICNVLYGISWVHVQ